MSDLRAVNEAFLRAFNRSELERLVRFSLGRELAHVADGPDLIALVFSLTSWAYRDGKLGQLIDAAKKESDNPLIQKLTTPEIGEEREYSNENIIEVLDQNVTNFELLDYRLRELQKDVERLSVVLTGPDGTTGVRASSLNNQRDIQDIKRSVSRLESALDTGPDLLKSRSAKILFTVICVFLASILIIVSAGAFGWV